jgi:hypothetical protein
VPRRDLDADAARQARRAGRGRLVLRDIAAAGAGRRTRGELVDGPRPAVSILRFRGALARSFELSPRLFMRLQAPALSMARAKQRRVKRKIEAGSWPPSGAG